jgi:anti-sigma B factor antagonist
VREPASELDEVEFRIEEQPFPGATILAVRGEADLHSAPRLRDALATAIEDGSDELVLDLSETTFVDSMTLGVLLGAMKRLRARGGHLHLVVPGADVRRIFEITLLDRVFRLHETREEAVRAAAASESS